MCVWAAVAGALWASVPAAGQSPAESRRAERVESLRRRAERHLERGAEERAARSARRALRLQPTDTAALEAYARALLTAEPEPVAQPDTAQLRAAARYRRVYARAAQQLGPAGPGTPHRRVAMWDAWAQAVQGELAAGVKRTSQLATLQDLEACDWLRRLAALAVRRDDLRNAETALRAALAALPQATEVSADLGAVLMARGRPEAALDYFRAVLARDRSNLSARRDLAGALVGAGRAHEGLQLLLDGGRTCTGDLQCLLDTARAALESGELDMAVQAAQGALRAGPQDDPEPALLLGEARARQGATAEAARAYQEALERRPDSARAIQGLEALQASSQDGP